jgi:peptidoglycan/LPS O-acetylase OafA/YrhL
MQNLVNEAPAKKNYDFIDTIRGIAMMSIVGEHCSAVGDYAFPATAANYWTQLCLMQFNKFGTVTFFLLAGFLIGEKFADYTPSQYLKRRISTTFGPWVFWSLVYCLADIITIAVQARMYHDDRLNLANILHEFKIVYLYTNYWFIVNFLVSISVLLIFRKHLYSLYLGAVLLLFYIFYAINIYYEWIEPRHTSAILGFVFFLWLGAQLRKHWHRVEGWVAKASYPILLFLLVLTFGSCIYEVAQLTGHSVDAFNTLRISNILFSLVFFALLLKIKTFKFVEYLKPRQTTYGIYLIHYILLVFLLPQILIHITYDVYSFSILQFILFKLAIFVFIYSITLGMVLLISNSPLKKLVGN